MGYLNNSTRTLDAILTKKGREILSSGGDFNVTKFALGDDEIDYALWDTTHTNGTDYYGAVIENLPALEPFNDPSEIMKYKLVSRTEGIQAMAKLIENAGSQTALNNLKWYADDVSGDGGTRVQCGPTAYYLGLGTQFGVGHVNNSDLTIDYVGGEDSIFEEGYRGEEYTLTVLDTTVAVMAPLYRAVPNKEYPVISMGGGGRKKKRPGRNPGGMQDADRDKWFPFVKSVQHLSQTIKGCRIDSGGVFRHRRGNNFTPTLNGALALYPKKITAASSPAKTSVLVSGETSGAVVEFSITITHRPTGTRPADDATSA
jgi:hypothetical protein